MVLGDGWAQWVSHACCCFGGIDSTQRQVKSWRAALQRWSKGREAYAWLISNQPRVSGLLRLRYNEENLSNPNLSSGLLAEIFRAYLTLLALPSTLLDAKLFFFKVAYPKTRLGLSLLIRFDVSRQPPVA